MPAKLLQEASCLKGLHAGFCEGSIIIRGKSFCVNQDIDDLWGLTHRHDSDLQQTFPCRGRCARSDNHTHLTRHGSSPRNRCSQSARLSCPGDVPA
jgi:hypothetical protein